MKEPPEQLIPCRIAALGMVSCAGDSGAELLHNLRNGRHGFRTPRHCAAQGHPAGVIPALDDCREPRGRALLTCLRERRPPPEVLRRLAMPLFLATTVGEIELLEQAGDPDRAPDTNRAMLEDARKLFPVGEATLTASACASGTRALELAAWSVMSGRSAAAMALGCDTVSSFVLAGFGALGALSSGAARPYAAGRDGLTLGEAAAWVVVMRDDLAEELSLPELGRVLAWGASCDAAHVTAPDTEARQPERAIRLALTGGKSENLAGIVGHGTGTVYNDAAEVAALRRIFPGPAAPPLFSVKGVTGHTLGATGLVQVIAGLSALESGVWPGAECGAAELMADARPFAAARALGGEARDFLSLTVGFGGLNDCILIRGGRR